MLRTPSGSVFRPKRRIDQGVLRDSRALVEKIDRRNVLRGALSLGALTFLTGCDVTEADQVQTALRAVSEWNDRVQRFIFRPNHLAPTFREAQVVKPPRFNAHYGIEDVTPVDVAGWQLELSGRINDKRSWTAEQIYRLPEQELIIRHICIEGWDYIGQWSGPSLSDFLKRIGADTRAKYISFKCADGYTETLDMATALHPQTLLTFRFADQILPPQYGFPMKLRVPTKLGFKNPKHIMAMYVTNTYPGGYWEDQGYNWFSGS